MINTVRKAVESFRTYLEDATGRPSEDFKYPPQLIYYHLNMVKNNMLYKNMKAKKKMNLDESIIQTIDCVELEKADLVECPCAPPSGMYWFKSTYKIPPLIGSIPLAVTSVDTMTDFSYVRWYNMQHKVNSLEKADSLQDYYTFKTVDNDFHLYVYSTRDLTDLRAVSIAAVFKNPVEVRSFKSCGEDDKVICNPLDEPFIIPEEIQLDIFKETFVLLQGLFSINRGLSDKLNDSNVGTTQQV